MKRNQKDVQMKDSDLSSRDRERQGEREMFLSRSLQHQ